MRQYQRRFDWDEAKRLREEGVPIARIAEKMGVSSTAIERVVIPGRAERMAAYTRQAVIGQGVCENCGAATNKAAQRRGSRYCVNCANQRRMTSVREYTLQCTSCKQWKADEEFQHDMRMPHRRSRRRDCRRCSNERRRQYRLTHRIPCAAGCGATISPSDQKANAKSRGKIASGMCSKCWAKHRRASRGNPEQSLQERGRAFREKFDLASAEAGTTEDE